jgi:hypothetical protein
MLALSKLEKASKLSDPSAIDHTLLRFKVEIAGIDVEIAAQGSVRCSEPVLS